MRTGPRTAGSTSSSGCPEAALAVLLAVLAAGCRGAAPRHPAGPPLWSSGPAAAPGEADDGFAGYVEDRLSRARAENDAEGLWLAEACLRSLKSPGAAEEPDGRGAVFQARLARAEADRRTLERSRRAAEGRGRRRTVLRGRLEREIQDRRHRLQSIMIHQTLLQEERQLILAREGKGDPAEIQAQRERTETDLQRWERSRREEEQALNRAESRFQALGEETPEPVGAEQLRAAEESVRRARADVDLYRWLSRRIPQSRNVHPPAPAAEKAQKKELRRAKIPEARAPLPPAQESDAFTGFLQDRLARARNEADTDGAWLAEMCLKSLSAPVPLEAILPKESVFHERLSSAVEADARLREKRKSPEAVRPDVLRAADENVRRAKEDRDLFHWLLRRAPRAEPARPAVRPVPRPAAPSGSAPSTPAPPAGASLYRAEKGDTLPSIAQKVYGDAGLWSRIYEANQYSILRGMPEPGQWLLIPRR